MHTGVSPQSLAFYRTIFTLLYRVNIPHSYDIIFLLDDQSAIITTLVYVWVRASFWMAHQDSQGFGFWSMILSFECHLVR